MAVHHFAGGDSYEPGEAAFGIPPANPEAHKARPVDFLWDTDFQGLRLADHG